MEASEETRRLYKSAVIIGASTIGSLLIFLAAVEFLRIQMKPFRGFAAAAGLPAIRYLFYGLAVVVVLVLRVLRQVFFRSGVQDDEKGRAHRIFRATVVTLVLAEGPALAGFILFLLAGLNMDFYALFLVSAVLEFMYFPRYGAWMEWVSS